MGIPLSVTVFDTQILKQMESLLKGSIAPAEPEGAVPGSPAKQGGVAG